MQRRSGGRIRLNIKVSRPFHSSAGRQRERVLTFSQSVFMKQEKSQMMQ